MTPGERRRKFGAERTRQLRALARLTRASRDEVLAALAEARNSIIRTLRSQPTDWELYHLQQVRRELEAAISRFETQGVEAWRTGTGAAWEAGIAIVDRPLEAAGVRLGNALTRISDQQLGAMQAFTTGRIHDIGDQTRRKVNAQLLQTLSGAQTPGASVNAIQSIFRSSRNRAITITRTELGRAFSTATQQRQAQVVQLVPELKKQWRRSGKLRSRFSHDTADGQIREVDEPFDVGGEQLMYPRDPTASAKNTINCGCTSLPYIEDWDSMSTPGRSPFSIEEIAANPLRRDINAGMDDDGGG